MFDPAANGVEQLEAGNLRVSRACRPAKTYRCLSRSVCVISSEQNQQTAVTYRRSFLEGMRRGVCAYVRGESSRDAPSGLAPFVATLDAG